MRRYHLSLTLAVVLLVLGHTRAVSGSDTPHASVSLAKLSPPIYPRVAQIAHIEGEVDLILRVRSDGSVESVAVLGGHPMLKEAAIDSAQQSQFDCVNCGAAVTSYALRYKFQIAPRDAPKDCDEADPQPPPPEFDRPRHQVTVFTWEVWTCDPVSSETLERVRSAKCLYLWRCGRHLVR